MKFRLTLFVGLSLALVVGAGWYIYQTLYLNPSAVTTQPAPQPTVQTVNGETVLAVNPDVQRASHIEVSPLVETSVQPTYPAYATVVDVQPLFDLRSRLVIGQADLTAIQAQARNSRTQYERSRVLFEDDRNVSQKSLQDALVVMQVDQAKLKSANATVSGVTTTMRQQFGDALTRAAIASDSALIQRLLSGRAVVLRVTLPAGRNEAAPAHLTVDAPDGRPVSARRLSLSPQGDPAVQGIPWLYAVDRALPVGTRTSTNVPSSSVSTSVLVIPEQAVIWYGGQTWAYVQTATDRFTRRYVPNANEVGQGFAVTSGFHAGDQVVTQGAQLLLSEELKPQGIATLCKDPPECDG